jgi:hypothetical protein
MFARKMPWHGLEEMALALKVVRGVRPARSDCNDCPGVEMLDDVWHLLESCWGSEAGHRPNMQTIRKEIAIINAEHAMRENAEVTVAQQEAAANGHSSDQADEVSFSSAPNLFSLDSPPPQLSASAYLTPAFRRHRARAAVGVAETTDDMLGDFGVLMSVAKAVPVLGAPVEASIEAIKQIVQYNQVSDSHLCNEAVIYRLTLLYSK